MWYAHGTDWQVDDEQEAREFLASERGWKPQAKAATKKKEEPTE
jgi:hypothetical protein